MRFDLCSGAHKQEQLQSLPFMVLTNVKAKLAHFNIYIIECRKKEPLTSLFASFKRLSTTNPVVVQIRQIKRGLIVK
jgi:hypothetical protein